MAANRTESLVFIDDVTANRKSEMNSEEHRTLKVLMDNDSKGIVLEDKEII